MEVQNTPLADSDGLAASAVVRVRPRSSARRLAYTLVTLALATVSLVSPSCQQSGKQETTQANDGTPVIIAAAPATVPAAGGDAAPAGPTLPAAVLAEAKYFSYPAAEDHKSEAKRNAGSVSCLICHGYHDSFSMHQVDKQISCVDCHGGNADAKIPAGITGNEFSSQQFAAARDAAHPPSRLGDDFWKTSGNPEIPGGTTLQETADYIRFINPGDLRAAMVSCGACHQEQVQKVRTSMMTHGAMLWGAALYNNGSYNRKGAIYGEQYTPDGQPARVISNPGPTTREFDQRGVLAQLWPLPRWEISQPGNILRVFERGAKERPIIGIPSPKEDPGRPEVKLSLRDFGTDVRTDPVNIGLQKTRLLDPTLNFAGTNDHPGDYRASGCSACHVVYANDRSPVHASLMGERFGGLKSNQFGNRGESFSDDPMVNYRQEGNVAPTTRPSDDLWNAGKPREPGHPIKHVMVRNMPTSSCISCHIHPGTNVVNAYLGFMWWDNETDGRIMYPKKQLNPPQDRVVRMSNHNPEASAQRGLWSNEFPDEVDHTGMRAGPNFLEKLGTPEFNERLTRTQFADFHGHGWVFRAVFKQDRHGNMLDYKGDIVPPSDPSKPQVFNAAMAKGVAFQSAKHNDHPAAGVPVHLKDIHLERGMQCVDCHFEADSHGNGKLYGETRNAVNISCEDCHGTATEPAKIYGYLQIRDGLRDPKTPKERDELLAGALTGNAAKGLPAKEAQTRNQKLVQSGSEKFRIRTEDNRFVQVSATDPKVVWTVPQVSETTDPESWWSKARTDAGPDRSGGATKAAGGTGATTRPVDVKDIDHATLARYAHTIRKDGKTWGGNPSEADLAHSNSRMSCYACHTSWNTSCFGCHLPQQANRKQPMLHNEAINTRNYTNYNYQTLRDDVYMIGVDSTTKDHKVVPIRSACAVMVSSQDANRQWIYTQQQTVSAEGYSGTAFSPYFPHTVRAAETKRCTDCHVSKANDNNAVMAQLLLQGTNSVNFIGRYAWVGAEHHGLEAVVVTEREEPQAVIGSTLHQLAYPDDFSKHVEKRNRKLDTVYDHHGTVLDLQVRGEYCYAACGEHGFIAYDIANIDNKGFSERIVTAPVSPLGQRFYVKTSYATSVCSPSTMAIDPTRPRTKITQTLSDGTVREITPNEEDKVTEIGDPSKRKADRPIHLMYAFIYVTDRDEGLVVVGNPLDSKNKPGVATLLDGDPQNNFLERALAFNPDGILKGARHMALHGTLAYIACEAGVVVVDLNDPLHPEIVKGANDTIYIPGIRDPRRITFQFRYGFVCDADGLKTIDVTNPRAPKVVEGAVVPLADAKDIYVSRTYGYVAAGKDGLVIVDLERPEQPRKLTAPQDFPDYNAAAGINDARAVRVAMTNSSLFAYVADGENGLKVLQLTSPEYTPTYQGFSPKPEPRLVSWHKTKGPAVAVSEGLDRDRAVDEAGNQLSVFGRKGARPFTLEEMKRLYIRVEDGVEKLRTVTDYPETDPVARSGSDAGGAGGTTTPATPEPPKPKPKLPFGNK